MSPDAFDDILIQAYAGVVHDAAFRAAVASMNGCVQLLDRSVIDAFVNVLGGPKPIGVSPRGRLGYRYAI